MPARQDATPLRRVGTTLLLGLFVVSPWPFGCASPAAQFVLLLAAMALAVLAVGHLWTTRRDFGLSRDGVFWCLLGLTTWTWLQTLPLPEAVVAVLSPRAVEWHRSLRPEWAETLPGESAAAAAPRPHWLPLSVAPLESQRLAGQLGGITLLYAAGRLLVGGGEFLRPAAWTGCTLGLLLSLAGMIQYLAGERERIYGRFDADSPVFGPFVNKNHFAFQVEVLIGLSLGLWLAEWRRWGWRSATTVGVFFVLGLMLASLVLSQCRGGLLTVGLSLTGTVTLATPHLPYRRALLGGLLLLLAMAASWLAWLGNDAVFARLATLGGAAADNRTPLWLETWRLVELFPLSGAGGGAYTIAELATRSRTLGPIISTTAHNEYLEAWIEGGVPRFLLTVLLAVFLLRQTVQTYRSRGEVLDLGVFFAVCSLAIHSVGDAGIHVPSVAVAATIAAIAAGSRRYGEAEPFPAHSLRPTAIVATLCVLGGSALWPASRDYLADYWQRRALAATTTSQMADCLERALAWRPRDFELWERLAALHLLRAVEANRTLHQSVGGALVCFLPADLFLQVDSDGHLFAALAASRAARDTQPLWPGPHLRIAALADRCLQADNTEQYLARAQQVGYADPDVWFASGQVWAARKEWTRALKCWRESLLRSPRHLAAIARWAVWSSVPPEQFRQEALPDDPLMWYRAARFLWAGGSDMETSRQWYAAVAESFNSRHERLADPVAFLAWADSLSRCGRPESALAVLEKGVRRFPADRVLRENLANRLEAEDRFAESLLHWQWLMEEYPHRGDYARRYAAARRAAELQRIIDQHVGR